jgi:hypothetical protein
MTKKEFAMNPFSDIDSWMDDEDTEEVCSDADGMEAVVEYVAEPPDEGALFYASENPLGVPWEQYYLIMGARQSLVEQGYIPLLGKDDGKWCFRIYGYFYPEADIMGVPVKNIPSVIPKVF